jgi:SulP family sulfate permease
MGVYRQSPRSATVLAQTPAQLWRLSLSAMQAMTQQDPALSVQLNQALLHLLADRLEHANAQVRALST